MSSAAPETKVALAAAFANVASEIRQLNVESTRARLFVCILAAALSFMLFSRLIMVPVLAQMLLYTLPVIWLGSHLSLDLRIGVQEGQRDKAEGEVLSSKEAALFPVLASAAIIILYLALKFLPGNIVNIILSVYVSLAGIFSVGETVASCLKLGFAKDIDEGPEYTFHFHWAFKKLLGDTIKIRVTKATVIGYSCALFITFGWLATKAWILHNLFAIGFCVQAIHLISVGSFKIASTLLLGLFAYDVFWVFGTDVMVKVATGFEAPLKLLFPIKRSPVQFSLLGLGDIVIPGIFVAMTLRFDYWMHSKRSGIADASKEDAPMFRNFRKFYFKSSLVAYALSIFLTGCIMLFFKKAQPALLYLVPAMLVSLYVPALFKRELGEVIAFSENDEDEDEKEEHETATSDSSEEELVRSGTVPPEETKKDQ